MPERALIEPDMLPVENKGAELWASRESSALLPSCLCGKAKARPDVLEVFDEVSDWRGGDARSSEAAGARLGGS